MHINQYIKPSLLFGFVYILAVVISCSAGFFVISIQTHALIFSLFLVALSSELLASVFIIKRTSQSFSTYAHSRVVVFSFLFFLSILFGLVLQIRINQLGEFSSVQAMRMALILGDLPALPFPLSNAQSLCHAFGIALLVLVVRDSRLQTPIDLKLAISVAFGMSVSIALLEGNRASFIIIFVQSFLILSLSHRLPSYRKLLAFAFSILVFFILLQFYVRQNVDDEGLFTVLDLVLRNVASYVSGGLVAFDQVFSGQASSPQYSLPFSGALASVLSDRPVGEDIILPFLDLGKDVYGNVYTALFYIGFLHNILIGFFVFTLLTFIASIYFRLSFKGPIFLLTASYLGVTFILWTLSEYWASLAPLFLREIIILLFLERFAFNKVRPLINSRHLRTRHLRTGT